MSTYNIQLTCFCSQNRPVIYRTGLIFSINSIYSERVPCVVCEISNSLQAKFMKRTPHRQHNVTNCRLGKVVDYNMYRKIQSICLILRQILIRGWAVNSQICTTLFGTYPTYHFVYRSMQSRTCLSVPCQMDTSSSCICSGQFTCTSKNCRVGVCICIYQPLVQACDSEMQNTAKQASLEGGLGGGGGEVAGGRESHLQTAGKKPR